jgi:hypothetical protein
METMTIGAFGKTGAALLRAQAGRSAANSIARETGRRIGRQENSGEG